MFDVICLAVLVLLLVGSWVLIRKEEEKDKEDD